MGNWNAEFRGIENVRLRFRSRIAVLEDLEPSLEYGMREFGAIEEEWFDSAGRGSWQPLTAGTVEYKGSSIPMVQSGALKASLVQPTVFFKSPNTIRFGTKVRYAKFHQKGFTQVWRFKRIGGTLHLVANRGTGRHQDARKVIDLSLGDRQRIQRAAAQDVISRLKRA